VVKRVLIYINATPDTLVVLIDRYDTNATTLASQMPFPQFLGPWFAHYGGPSGILTVRLLFLYFVCAIRKTQAIKDG
jgi:hypothetical protein